MLPPDHLPSDDPAMRTAPVPTGRPAPRPWRRWLTWTALAAACGLIFAAYRAPAFMQTVADQLWACF